MNAKNDGVIGQTLDKKLAFLDAGNSEDWAKFCMHFICLHKFCPILYEISVGNLRKRHVLVNRTCRKSNFWPSETSIIIALFAPHSFATTSCLSPR